MLIEAMVWKVHKLRQMLVFNVFVIFILNIQSGIHGFASNGHRSGHEVNLFLPKMSNTLTSAAGMEEVAIIEKMAVGPKSKTVDGRSREVRAAAMAPALGDFSIGCGVTKECFMDSAGGLVTYALTPDEQNFFFEMQTEAGSTYDWIAFGLGTSPNMGPASVLECVRFTDTGKIVVQHSYNTDDVSGMNNHVIDSRGIIVNETSYNGQLQCSFWRPILCQGALANPNIYNITQPYYLMLAKGYTSTPGVKAQHSISPSPELSLLEVNLNVTNTTNSTAGTTNACSDCQSFQAHGCLMITAWVLLTSTAIFMPRYFKAHFGAAHLIFKLQAWFQIHRALMLATLACTAAGFILIFVVNQGQYSNYDPTSPSYFYAHAPVGIAVMILVIANPVMAAFRCQPDNERRPIFNWLHFIVGTCCQILAVLNIFFGLEIGISYGIVNPELELVLIINRFIPFKKMSEASKSNNYRLANNSSGTFDMAESQSSLTKSKPKSRVSLDFVLLGVYVTVVFGIWLAMIVLIGLTTSS